MLSSIVNIDLVSDSGLEFFFIFSCLIEPYRRWAGLASGFP